MSVVHNSQDIWIFVTYLLLIGQTLLLIRPTDIPWHRLFLCYSFSCSDSLCKLQFYLQKKKRKKQRKKLFTSFQSLFLSLYTSLRTNWKVRSKLEKDIEKKEKKKKKDSCNTREDSYRVANKINASPSTTRYAFLKIQ